MTKQEFGAEKVGLEYVSFMKNAFGTWVGSVTSIQDQGERLLNLALKQGDEGYEEWQKILRDWVDNGKKAREQFQKAVDDNLKKMEEFLSKQE